MARRSGGQGASGVEMGPSRRAARISDAAGGRAADRAAMRSAVNWGPAMRQLVETFVENDDGATAIEYGLIAALIAVITIVGMTTAGGGLQALFNATANRAT